MWAIYKRVCCFTDVHIKVHPEWEPLANGTFTSGRLVHTGQLFVDDELNGVIDKVCHLLTVLRRIQ